MEAPKIVDQVEVVSRLQADIDLAFATIEELLPQIGHSEAKRLFLAATKYPCEIADFSKESEAMIRLFSASKNVNDALVAMGVEVVITQMIENQQKAQNNVPVDETGVPNPNGHTVAEPKAAPKKRKTKKAE